MTCFCNLGFTELTKNEIHFMVLSVSITVSVDKHDGGVGKEGGRMEEVGEWGWGKESKCG